MKMQKRLFSPIPWTKVGLAILPGLFTVGVRSGLFRQFSVGEFSGLSSRMI